MTDISDEALARAFMRAGDMDGKKAFATALAINGALWIAIVFYFIVKALQ